MKKFITTRSYEYDISTLEKIKGSKIWRNNEIPESTSLEYKFNNPKEYIKDNFNFPTTILEEYPEYLAGWQIIITNTGLVCFYDSSKVENNFVIYDLLEKENDDSISLGSVKPDISMLLEYDIFNQPLSVRRINFKDNEFIPERSYTYNGKWHGFFNCDGVNNNTTLDDNFFFEFEGDKPDIENIQFNYKPLFVFKIYNTDGTEKDNANIKIDGIISATRDSKGIYFIDLSARNSKDLVSISLEDCGSGYLEVI